MCGTPVACVRITRPVQIWLIHFQISFLHVYDRGVSFMYKVLQIRASWSVVSYYQSLVFYCTHICHVIMIILTGGFSIYYYFLEIILNDLELVFLEFKHFYKAHTEQVCFLFICSFFTCYFVIILCI